MVTFSLRRLFLTDVIDPDVSFVVDEPRCPSEYCQYTLANKRLKEEEMKRFPLLLVFQCILLSLLAVIENKSARDFNTADMGMSALMEAWSAAMCVPPMDVLMGQRFWTISVAVYVKTIVRCMRCPFRGASGGGVAWQLLFKLRAYQTNDDCPEGTICTEGVCGRL